MIQRSRRSLRAPAAAWAYNHRHLEDSWLIWLDEALDEMCISTDPTRIADLARFVQTATEALADLGVLN